MKASLSRMLHSASEKHFAAEMSRIGMRHQAVSGVRSGLVWKHRACGILNDQQSSKYTAPAGEATHAESMSGTICPAV